MIRFALTWMISAGVIALVACSSDSAGERYGSIDAFCGAKAEEECNAVAETCGATLEKCKGVRVNACNVIAGAATSEGRIYRADSAERCIDKTREVFADRTIDPAKEREQAEVCERVFTGTRKSSETCAKPTDCEGDLTCSNGVCFDKTEKAKGEPCANAGDVCAKGSYCGNQGTTKFCLPKNELGVVCNAEAPCLEDLRCVNVCAAKLNAGDPCETADDCSTGFCDPGARKCAKKSFAIGAAVCKDFGG